MRIEGNTVFAMSPGNQPAASVKDGSQITFITKDCFNNQFGDSYATLETINWDAINPATGPVYIEGAESGDILRIKIDSIKLADTGTMAAIPDSGVLGSIIKQGVMKRIPVKNGIAYFTDTIQLPCNPMIGVIGVAPGEGSVFCGEPGSHGGNMDNTKIKEGAVLYLPVFCDGALLAIGDVHACMGDGEIMVTGIEIAAEVTVTVEVVKGVSIENPMLEDETSCYTIASDEDIEKAIFTAAEAMTEVVMRHKHISFEEAGMLLSAAGNLQFCQVVDPKRTVRMELRKSILKNLF